LIGQTLSHFEITAKGAEPRAVTELDKSRPRVLPPDETTAAVVINEPSGTNDLGLVDLRRSLITTGPS
jgi:hypothetical protein